MEGNVTNTSESIITIRCPSNNTTTANISEVAQERQNQGLQERTCQTTKLSPKDISYKHYERLIEELKCPGCAYPMKSPIYLCKTGHSICEQCTRILFLCPLCNETFTNMRSRTVEALCSKAQFRCSNSAGGCTIRLQIDLLPWHEKQCFYKPIKCFMGQVWGDCQWSGREDCWQNHLESEHSNKVFFSDCANLVFNMRVKNKALTGYYVFQVYDEMFNFYEVYDKERLLFTMTCSSTQRTKKYQFAYEFVHYYVKILEVISPMHSRISSGSKSQNLPIDFEQTQIQGVNLKSVASDVILTRHTEGNKNINNANFKNELDQMEQEFFEKLAKHRGNDNGSGSDPEFAVFLKKKWSAPQLNFNCKYLKTNNLSETSSNASLAGQFIESGQ